MILLRDDDLGETISLRYVNAHLRRDYITCELRVTRSSAAASYLCQCCDKVIAPASLYLRGLNGEIVCGSCLAEGRAVPA